MKLRKDKHEGFEKVQVYEHCGITQVGSNNDGKCPRCGGKMNKKSTFLKPTADDEYIEH